MAKSSFFIRANVIHPETGQNQIAAVEPESGIGKTADGKLVQIYENNKLKDSVTVWPTGAQDSTKGMSNQTIDLDNQ